MGLDQYAYTVPDSGDLPLFGNPRPIPPDFERMTEEERALWRKSFPRITLMYWRKHPDLHGWMEELYKKRGGVDTFNCVSLRLFEEDLIALREAVSNHSLPKTSGFFFGESNPNGGYEDYGFICRALSAIECGWAVYYDSWW